MADLGGDKFSLPRFPVHLGLGARVVQLPEFTGEMSWYEDYGASCASDGDEGRLVSFHRFTESWDSWEVHPRGDELVFCVEGRMTIHQEKDGETRTVTLEAGEAVVNAPGVWHTADIEGSAAAVFITAGVGTEVKPR